MIWVRMMKILMLGTVVRRLLRMAKKESSLGLNPPGDESGGQSNRHKYDDDEYTDNDDHQEILPWIFSKLKIRLLQ